MRILLDECLDFELRFLLPEHTVETVQHCGWKGKKNGDLLRLAEKRFDVMITPDKNIPSQQYLSQFDLCLIVLRPKSLMFKIVKELFDRIPEVLDQVAPGKVIIIKPE